MICKYTRKHRYIQQKTSNNIKSFGVLLMTPYDFTFL